MTKAKAQKKDKGKAPYRIAGSPRDMNIEFYERYDENLLFNKAATLMQVVTEGEAAKQRVDALLVDNGSAPLSDKYMDSLRAEVFFTMLHQFEGFFALLLAAWQPLPHWVYLTAYQPGDIRKAVEKFLARRIDELTSGLVDDVHEFVAQSIYTNIVTAEPDDAARWHENIDNVCWLIRRMGNYYLENLKAYNSYKHGLRVMTGYTYFGLAPENSDGTPQGPIRILHASDDSLQYLQFEVEHNSDTGREIPVTEVTKHFSPEEAFFYLAKMQQMLETVRATRLRFIRGDSGPIRINTFFRLDRDEIAQRSVRTIWSDTPLSNEEARQYKALRTALAQRNAEAPIGPTDDTTS